jgi:hypothetical protein
MMNKNWLTTTAALWNVNCQPSRRDLIVLGRSSKEHPQNIAIQHQDEKNECAHIVVRLPSWWWIESGIECGKGRHVGGVDGGELRN